MRNTSFYFHIELKPFLLSAFGLIVLYLFAMYLSAQNEFIGIPDKSGFIAGYWSGLWDGICAPISLFRTGFDTQSEIVYNHHNNGVSYVFGYLLPIGHYVCFKFLKFIVDKIF